MVIKFDYKFLLVIILTFSLFFIFFNYKMKNKENEIINLQNSILESEGFHKNEKLKLDKAISALSKDNIALKKKIENIKKSSTIEYIVETKYITKTITKTLDSIPNEYIYFDSNNIPVCKFEMKENKPAFSTLNLDYTLSTLIEENYSYSILNIKDYKGNNHEILMDKKRLESKVIKIEKEKKYFNPKISLGLALNYSNKLSISPIINLNLIEINPKINILSPSLLLQEKALGLSLIDYNIGSKDTIVSDSWLGLGVYSNLNQTYYSINLSSRF